ncbi:MAG: hypothetical protein LC768_13650 [Acidobacteria bacterium]|nr:hypothetical protein [Acidobacteriota bacterium]MCA1639355.1 hypothetical protein [Acidobacteriota bacterium]
MQQKEKPIEQHQQLQEYGEWLLSELKKQSVELSVVGVNGLHIKGEVTLEQKENIRLWKRQLINALSPKCSNCTLPMQLINDETLWFCPFGCESRNKNIAE